jgi:hypothetical protein
VAPRDREEMPANGDAGGIVAPISAAHAIAA